MTIKRSIWEWKGQWVKSSDKTHFSQHIKIFTLFVIFLIHWKIIIILAFIHKVISHKRKGIKSYTTLLTCTGKLWLQTKQISVHFCFFLNGRKGSFASLNHINIYIEKITGQFILKGNLSTIFLIKKLYTVECLWGG